MKYRVFMIMARSLLLDDFIILKLEETIAKSDKSKEICHKQSKTAAKVKIFTRMTNLISWLPVN